MTTPIIIAYTAGLLLCAFILSAVLSRIMIRMGPKLGLMDQPDARRIHVHPIPRAGGLAIWITYLIMVFAGGALFPAKFDGLFYRQMEAFAAAGTLLLAVGLVDDRRGLRPLVKLAGQIAASVVFFVMSTHGGHHFFGNGVPVPLAGVLFVGWSVLLINAFNLIDGLDGLCGGLVFISLVIIGGIEVAGGRMSNALMILLMAAAVAGFMRYNLHPARIFLGDAGSMLLGFFLASVATQTGGRRAVIASVLLPLAIAGVPLLDVLLAVWRRSLRNLVSRWSGGGGVGVFSADKDHLHHRLLAMGLSQRHVALLMQGMAAALAGLVFIPMLMGARGLMIAVCILVIACLYGLRHLARVELLQSGSFIHLAVKRRQGGERKRLLYFTYDIICLVVAAVAAVAIETNSGKYGYGADQTVRFVTLFLLCELAVLQILRVYRRVWSRAVLSEFLMVAFGLVVGGLGATAMLWSSTDDPGWTEARCALLAVGIACWLVLMPRALPEMLRELSVGTSHGRLTRRRGDARQLLVYGAGDLGNLFLKYLKICSPHEFKGFQVSGFLDDSPALKGRTIHGFRIHGGLECLEEICRRYPVHGIMIAMHNCPENRLREIMRIAADLKLHVYHWQVDLEPRRIAAGAVPSPAGTPQAAGARPALELLPTGGA